MNFRNWRNYPRLNFAFDVFRDFVLILAILIMVRLFRWGYSTLDKMIPNAYPPTEIAPYLPISATRVFVTVLDSVAMVTIVIIGVFSIVKIVKELLEHRKDEKP